MSITKNIAETYEDILGSLGYERVSETVFKNEDWSWWKTVTNGYEDPDGNDIVLYKLGVLFYDFSKYMKHEGLNPIGLSFEVVCSNHVIEGRYDLSITDYEMTIEEFETIAERYYNMLAEFMGERELKMIRNLSGA